MLIKASWCICLISLVCQQLRNFIWASVISFCRTAAIIVAAPLLEYEYSFQSIYCMMVPLNMSWAGWVEKSIWMWNRRRRYEYTLEGKSFHLKILQHFSTLAIQGSFSKDNRCITEEDILKLLKILPFQESCKNIERKVKNNKK